MELNSNDEEFWTNSMLVLLTMLLASVPTINSSNMATIHADVFNCLLSVTVG